MSTDETEHPVDSSADTQPQRAVSVNAAAGETPDQRQQSRRKFLRTAVVSGVAVAAVGATAGVVAASNPHSGVLKSLGVHLGTASTHANCNMCLEKSGFKQIDAFDEKNKFEFWLWFTAYNLAPGSYTMTIQQDPGGLTAIDVPFQYIAGSEAKLFKLDPNTADTCPDNEGNDSNKVANGTSIGACFPYTITGTNVDLQLNVHFQWVGPDSSGPQLYTFTGTLKDGDGNTICTATASATGTPTD